MRRDPSYVWNGQPVYRCQVCGDHYERVGNLESVLEHEAEAHPAAETFVRPSLILGTDGRALQVEEKVQ